ncbi:MAG: hypothetical protein Kow0020_09270 [Wenzhouxiangellaceae bacterium]
MIFIEPKRFKAAVCLPKSIVLAFSLSVTGLVWSFEGMEQTMTGYAYAGDNITLSRSDLVFGSESSASEVVAQILGQVGLPQNFEILETPEVPNAAAVIVVGEDRIPRRLIAYNPTFIEEVRRTTGKGDWAPVSIMAHEIGHHLSGHTLEPGGSQHGKELEADKFSGFVLFKMGASLDDATIAIRSFVSERGSQTHPPRSQRVRAITEGWEQACRQQQGRCDAESTREPAPSPAPTDEPALVAEAVAPAELSDQLPEPSEQAIPLKMGRFVLDELGLLDPTTRAAFEERMREHAAKHQVEIVSIIARDLYGMAPDDYALAMLRQLRVGKLDVGNGAVLVAVPGEGAVGLAFGPGLAVHMADYVDLEKKRLKDFLTLGMPRCTPRCGANETEMFLAAAAHIADDTDTLDWTIRFQSLSELLAARAEVDTARSEGRSIRPQQDPTWRSLVRVEGTLVARDARGQNLDRWINARRADSVGVPLHVRTDDGRDLIVYANPAVEALMPSPMKVGQRHAWILRTVSLTSNPQDALSFDLLSYDPL